MPPTEPHRGPKPIVISGPSGSGKSTITNRLIAAYPDRFMFSVSHTTRRPRSGEVPGQHYYFLTRDQFDKLIAEGGFIEHAEFSGNKYGTSYMAVQAAQDAGKTCILDIEMEGVKQMHNSHLQARYLFLSPPSYEELEKRLRGRGTDKEEDIQKRLKQAKTEMEYAETEGVHDKKVVNDDLEKAYKEVEEFCLAE
ncbi:guanylate kinase [Microthyrium microscopicum]|uniref:Guanylate kinase n=1 Tax=Microthyrium microscopicum TaxID=703497 RepID=A0A6A6UNA0_9PEZI|nr:guanylate kinase [Microthyrium microscopicum]